ncbi:MAG: DHH family phosphoesterase [Myxococcota bacterium]
MSEPLASTASAPLVLYHGDCIDGFGAAWAAWRRLRDRAEYREVHHDEAPPDVDGRAVMILDFAYPRGTLLAMAEQASELVVIDHHKTARDALVGLEFCRFDLERSGAVLAWEHFHPGEPVPELLLHVQDKDLWQWQLAGTAEIIAALRSYPMDFARWSQWVDDWETGGAKLRAEGVAILRYEREVIRALVRGATERTLGGYRILAANAPLLQSEVANVLAEGRPFGVAWYEAQDRRFFSLRSREEGIDVAELARQFGGGGHPRAAGFSRARGEPDPLD